MAFAGNGVLRGYLARRSQAATGAAPLITPPVAPPPPPDIGQAAALAAGRAGQAVAGLVLHGESASAGSCSLAELVEILPEQPLLAMIEGDRDRLGTIALSPDMLIALIEMQAFGRVTDSPPETRKPTRADAALASDFINAMLAGLSAEAMRIPGAGAFVGYRYASHLADPHPLGLMLEDRGLRTLRLDLSLGAGGQRRGTIFMAIPAIDGPDARPAPSAAAAMGDWQPGADRDRALPDLAAGPAGASASATAPPDSPASTTRATLAAAMQQAPIPLNAVLCRRRISLAELRSLGPGTMLSLPRQSLAEARLETAAGAVLATGKLGEAEGFHALRLHDPRGNGRSRPDLRDPLMPDAAPIGDLGEPDDFRPPDPGDPAAVQNWQHALAETPGRA